VGGRSSDPADRPALSRSDLVATRRRYRLQASMNLRSEAAAEWIRCCSGAMASSRMKSMRASASSFDTMGAFSMASFRTEMS
jgi:hypothetical protein